MDVTDEIAVLLKRPVSLMSEEELEESFTKMVTIMEMHPQLKPSLKYVFASTLAAWGKHLERTGSYDKLFEGYQKALCIFHDHEGILTNLGAHLLRTGYTEEASAYFQEALRMNHSYLPAQRNLETVYNMCIERWHFRMLNDSIRNSSFKEAIIKKVRQGFDIVLDIGTGTGILSLFAVEGGAVEIYACDTSKTMIEISKKVLDRNNAMGKVKLLHKLSNDLRIPSDIPKRVSLVITETVDVGVVGENILQTLIHAWNSLLLPCSEDTELHSHTSDVTHKTGCVIPYSADVWVAAVECSYIDLKYRVLKHNPNQCSHDKLQNCKCHDYLDFLKFNLFACDGHAYDSVDMQNVPQGFRFLTKPAKSIEINFNDCKKMEDLLNGTIGEDTLVLCEDEGRIDAIVLWFDLKLDEDVVLSSAPLDLINRAKCWEQAIFPFKVPANIKKDQTVSLNVHCKEGKMSVKVNSLEPSESVCQTVDSESSFLHGSNDTSLDVNYVINSFMQNTDYSNLRSLPVSPEIVSYLNDKDLITSLNETFHIVTQSSSATNSIDILDLSPFPILGLAFLVNEQTATGKCNSSLTCITREEQDKTAILLVASANSINQNQILIINDEPDESLNLTKKFDVILTHPVEASGKFNERYATYLPLLSQVRKPAGIVLPKEIKLCCKIIESEWLKEVSEVIGKERVCGYDIAPLINEYKVSEHLDFVLSATEHNSYTEVVETPGLSIDELTRSINEPLVFKVPVCIKNDGFVNALPYWFKIKMFEGCSEVSTGIHSSFANQTAILLDNQIQVKADDSVFVTFMCFEGLIQITITK